MTPERDDDLRSMYLEASAQDPRRPAVQVGDAVRAHARMVLQARSRSGAAAAAPPAHAANQARWKVRVLASVAVMGLAGLLALQFDRGTPQEKELVAGLPQVSAPVSRNELPSVVAPVPAPVTATTTAPTATTTTVAEATATGAGATADAGLTAATGTGKGKVTRVETTKTAAEVAAVAAAPAQARPEQNSLASVAPPVNPAVTVPLVPMAPTAARAAMRSLPAAGPDNLHPVQALLDAARLGQLEPLNRLLVPGALVDAPDANGQTPLMLAAINGHVEVVRRLLAAGARRELRDPRGQTAADHARRLGQGDIVRLIEAGS